MGMTATGISETVEAFSRAAALMRSELREELHQIGVETRDLARAIADAEGLTGVGKYPHSRDPHPGALVAKIRVSSGVRRVTITEHSRSHSAHYPNYPYPRRYEYQGRAFMRPAAERERLTIPARMRLLVERTQTEAGF